MRVAKNGFYAGKDMANLGFLHGVRLRTMRKF